MGGDQQDLVEDFGPRERSSRSGGGDLDPGEGPNGLSGKWPASMSLDGVSQPVNVLPLAALSDNIDLLSSGEA